MKNNYVLEEKITIPNSNDFFGVTKDQSYLQNGSLHIIFNYYPAPKEQYIAVFVLLLMLSFDKQQ